MEDGVDDTVSERLRNDPRYKRLVSERSRLGWTLTGIIFVAYYGFIALIAFDRSLLARPIGTGVMSVGILVGFGLILLTVMLTGIYVWRANQKFDPVIAELIEDVV